MKCSIIATVVNFFRRDSRNVITADIGSGDLRNVDYCQQAGDDSPPLDEDAVVVVPLTRNGIYVAVATADMGNQGIAQRGEKRIYGRDDSGTEVNQIHLMRDGSITVRNNAGSLTLTPTGDVQMTGNLIVGGNVTATGALAGATAVVGGIPFASHTHGGVTTGSGTTGPAQ